MKKALFILLALLVASVGYNQINLNKIKRGINKGEEVLEKKEDKKEEEEKKEENTEEEKKEEVEKSEEASEEQALKIWTKFDFVPGNDLIFEDNQENEELGEFPSRWDLAQGNAEMAKLNDLDIIKLVSQGTSITPLMDKKEYLPEVFTIEFDIWASELMPSYKLYLYDMKQYKKDWRSVETIDHISIGSDETEMGDYSSKYEKLTPESWHHISLAFNKRSLKVYVNETRVLNIPNLEFVPKAFSVGTGAGYARDSDIWLFKNFRVAEGGKALYNRQLSEGKIVTNGILFDVGKATIKPQSMGVINKIYNMMEEDPGLKFEIVGHTDNTGGEETNLELSKKRAEAVMNKLVDMGISPDRMKYDGKGEAEPVKDNSSAEGRAMNRRVEFIKF